jgi:ankyrin repeat protein
MSDTPAQLALEAASSAGQYDKVLAILDQQPYASQDQSSPDSINISPLQSSLYAAARHGHANIVSSLLKRGAKYDRETVWATLQSKSIPVFQVLLDAGWDPNWSLSHSGTALLRAIIEKNLALVAFLTEHGADPCAGEELQTYSTLARAAIHSSTEIVQLLLSYGVQVRQSGALDAAAFYGRIDMIQLLLDHGADINEISDNDWTSRSEREAGLGTALHTAAAHGQVEAVSVLLEKGADLSLKDTVGKTALQRASESGHEVVVEVFKKHSGIE